LKNTRDLGGGFYRLPCYEGTVEVAVDTASWKRRGNEEHYGFLGKSLFVKLNSCSGFLLSLSLSLSLCVPNLKCEMPHDIPTSLWLSLSE